MSGSSNTCSRTYPLPCCLINQPLRVLAHLRSRERVEDLERVHLVEHLRQAALPERRRRHPSGHADLLPSPSRSFPGGSHDSGSRLLRVAVPSSSPGGVAVCRSTTGSSQRGIGLEFRCGRYAIWGKAPFKRQELRATTYAPSCTMASAARGAEEEVFETPDFEEDDLEETAAGNESGLPKTANKVSLYTQNKSRRGRGTERKRSSLGHRSRRPAQPAACHRAPHIQRYRSYGCSSYA